MKAARSVLIGVVVLVAALLVCLAVALNASFQTWLVHRQLAKRPDLHLSVGRVAAGFSRVEISDVRFDLAGGRWVAPEVSADASLLSLVLRHDLRISRLVAKGWTWTPAAAASPAATGAASPATASTSSADGTQPKSPFGVFPHLQLPVDTVLDRIETQGNIMLPSGRGSLLVGVTGGGLASGREGRFDVSVRAVLTDPAVNAVETHGAVAARMETPRTFSAVTGVLDATASGPHFTAPLGLHSEFALGRDAAGENYSVSLSTAGRRLLSLVASVPSSGAPISGSWQADLRDADVSPFALGRPLPTFAAKGEGRFETDRERTTVHAAGRLDASVDRLAALAPQLSGVGPVAVKADFDVSQKRDVLAVTRADVTIRTDHPVARVHALQPFDFNLATGALRATDSSRELLDIVLEGVPLAWAQPFFPAVRATGSDVRGELVASPRGGGISLHSKAPLVVTDFALERDGRPWLRHLDLALNASADYTPQAWQAAISGLTAKSENRTVLLLDAKAGQLAGANQPVKATGLLSLDLPVLFRQPVLDGLAHLTRGDATVEFAASLTEKKEVEASITLRNLAAASPSTGEPLPTVTARLRADLDREGRLTVQLPLELERVGRKSDITLAGSFTAGTGGGTFDAQATSANFVLNDAEDLAAVIESASSRPSGTPPFWARLNGTLALQFKNLVYPGAVQFGNVTGTVRFAGGIVTFDHMRAGVGPDGNAAVSAAITFSPGTAHPYAFGADLAVTDFDAMPLLMSEESKRPPVVEGRFVVTGRLAGQGDSLAGMQPAGQCEITSRGGTFRGLPVNVGNLVENSSKLASWIASAGNAITSLAGRKDYDEITSRSEAANELAKLLSGIAYDQMSMTISTDAESNAVIKDFALISPDIRLSGNGRMTHLPGHGLADDIVTMDYQLRARGRAAELMKYLGVLNPKPDDLGYAACTIPLKVGGTIARLDATDASNRLVALAVAKTGLTEKAVDWINRLRGKSTN